MAETKDRVLSYRRAIWSIQQPNSIALETCLVEAVRKLNSVAQRTIKRAPNQLLKLVSVREMTAGGLNIHLTAETPGEAASIVPEVDPSADEVEVSTTAPPRGTEFMDGDAFLFIKKNDVCLCTTGMHESAIQFFLAAYFTAAGLRKDAIRFELAKVASISALKLLQKQGVQEIDLRGVLYDATAHYQARKNQTVSILGAVAKHLKAIVGNEHDANHDALQASLTIKADKRRTGGLVLGYNRLQILATDLVKSRRAGDSFVIVTKQGQRIGPDEIFMRARVSIEGYGKSVNRDEAWKQLRAFYRNLDDAGALEQ